MSGGAIVHASVQEGAMLKVSVGEAAKMLAGGVSLLRPVSWRGSSVGLMQMTFRIAMVYGRPPDGWPGGPGELKLGRLTSPLNVSEMDLFDLESFLLEHVPAWPWPRQGYGDNREWEVVTFDEIDEEHVRRESLMDDERMTRDKARAAWAERKRVEGQWRA